MEFDLFHDVEQGDCLELLKSFPDNSIDSVVTDPPYGLSKEPDMVEVLKHWLAGDDYKHNSKGFMGKSWDSFVPGPSVWREVFRVLKPGGHMLVFSGTRTYDLTVLAIRLAGFEIRDQLAWMYGTGFPKSLDVSKTIDNHLGAVRASVGVRSGTGNKMMCARENGKGFGPVVTITTPGSVEGAQWEGWGTALKPAQEPIALCRKPLVGTVAKNVLTHGTGGLNVDGCRVGKEMVGCGGGAGGGGTWNETNSGLGKSGNPRPVEGRWPANVLLDEGAAEVLDEQSGVSKSPSGQITQGGDHFSIGSNKKTRGTKFQGHGDSGGASRFFYVAKASKGEREKGLENFRTASAGELTGGRKEGSDGLNNPRAGAGRGGERKCTHPTVKPVALMRYLVRLITPPGGVVLDPYTGSGTTGIACKLEGFSFAGLELNEEYVTLARARIAAW